MQRRLTVIDLESAALRNIAGLSVTDEAMLGAVHAILRGPLSAVSDLWINRLERMPGVSAALTLRDIGMPDVRATILTWLDRLTGGPYDDEFVNDLEEAGILLMDLQITLPDLIAASTDFLQWGRGELLRTLTEWRRVNPLYSALERVVNFALMLIAQGMTQAIIEGASNAFEIEGSGSFLEPAKPPSSPNLPRLSKSASAVATSSSPGASGSAAAPAEVAHANGGVPRPRPAPPPPTDTLAVLRHEYPAAPLVLGDYAGRCKSAYATTDGDQYAGLAQLIARKAIQLSKLLGLRTFYGAAVVRAGNPPSVIGTLDDGLLWIDCENPHAFERVQAMVLDSSSRPGV